MIISLLCFCFFSIKVSPQVPFGGAVLTTSGLVLIPIVFLLKFLRILTCLSLSFNFPIVSSAESPEHPYNAESNNEKKNESVSHLIMSNSLRPHGPGQDPLSMEFSRQEYRSG